LICVCSEGSRDTAGGPPPWSRWPPPRWSPWYNSTAQVEYRRVTSVLLSRRLPHTALRMLEEREPLVFQPDAQQRWSMLYEASHYTLQHFHGVLISSMHPPARSGGRVDTRVRRHQRGLSVEADAPSCIHTPCTTTLHSCFSPLSPYTLLSHYSSVSTLQLHRGCSPKCRRWVPPCRPALHTRADSTQHQ
jgi:hypothetical protein